MSADPEAWTKLFSHNEAIWQTAGASASSQQNAWRTQTTLLLSQANHLSESDFYAMHQEHQNKCTMHSSRDTYFNERITQCQQLVQQSRRFNSGLTQAPHEFQFPGKAAFEPNCCCGAFESCKHNQNEMTESLLRPTLTADETTLKGRPNKIQHFLEPDNDKRQMQKDMTATGSESLRACEGFRTAREQQILMDMQKKKPNGRLEANGVTAPCDLMNFKKKTLGGRRGVNSGFVPPLGPQSKPKEAPAATTTTSTPTVDLPPALAHLDAQMVQQILQETMHNYKHVAWEDIAGLESAKSTFLEAIILPLRRPDLYTGVRCPPRGVLLFGPPGTGKTLIAKSIASQARAKFFSINPSTLTSKWVGEGEKLVKTLFAVAAAHQPAIIFLDEVDSLLSKRSGNEHESSLRLKNEFLIHLDGSSSNEENQILVIGATNRPQELDEAVRRRFVRRLYIPLPDKAAREVIITKTIKQVKHNLLAQDIQELADLTDGYSGADMDSLCRYASMAPLRKLSSAEIDQIQAQQLPPVTMDDFRQALKVISRSVSPEDTQRFVTWNDVYGSKH